MNVLPYLFLLAVLQATSLADTPVSTKKFPSWFKFGVATASYQVEGAWNADGKGENIWDHLAHFGPYRVENNDTGDIACKSYYRYRRDVDMLRFLGVSHYRFSLSWTRILPNGIGTIPNRAGILYYKNLISALKAKNIEPLVTIFHWDTPQALQNRGGFANSSMVEWYSNYARICFKEFGNKVKYWFTFNEPKQTCNEGYGSGTKAPLIKSPGIDEYKCIHNVIKSHAAAWHIYNNEFREKQNGKVGIVLDSNWMEPENNTNPDDLEAAETRRQFVFGFYANPLFFGKYPDVVVKNIDRRSRIQNFSISRLPRFSPEESRNIKGTVDVLGFNSYSSEIVKAVKNPDLTTMGLYADSEVEAYQPPSWPSSGSSWLKVVPWGIGNVLKWADKTYNHPEIIITENGMSDRNGTLEDDFRIKYFQEYLTSIQNAINEGVNVTRYTAWSLMDNFEWMTGYSEKFGLYHVDFNDPHRPRTAKKSAFFYRRLIKTRCLVETCEDSY